MNLSQHTLTNFSQFDPFSLVFHVALGYLGITATVLLLGELLESLSAFARPVWLLWEGSPRQPWGTPDKGLEGVKFCPSVFLLFLCLFSLASVPLSLSLLSLSLPLSLHCEIDVSASLPDCLLWWKLLLLLTDVCIFPSSPPDREVFLYYGDKEWGWQAWVTVTEKRNFSKVRR